MDWVVGTGRDGFGIPCVVVQLDEDSRAWVPLTDLQPHLRPHDPARRSVTFDVADMVQGDTSAYLEGLGWNLADTQPVYEVATDICTVVIPAQVLILSLFGVNRPQRKILLRPWSPSLLMTAVVEGDKLTSEPTPNTTLRSWVGPTRMDDRMAWVLAYPSAHAAWASVYAKAIGGVFDLQLPHAKVETLLRGEIHNGKLLVTSMVVKELTPTEDPFPFAAKVGRKSFVLHVGKFRRPTHGKAAAPAADAAVAPGGSIAPLNDEQWARVKGVIEGVLKQTSRPGAPRRHSLRDIFEVIRIKLGTPCSWAKTPADKHLVQGASVLLSKLQCNGVWAEVLKAMA